MSDRLKAVGQVLSGVAVTVSLVFLALEVRQGTLAARAQTLQEMSLAASEMQFLFAANPEVAATYYDMFRKEGPRYHDGRPLTPHSRADSVAARFALYGLMRRLENVYTQAELGIVDREVLQRFDFESPTFTSQGFAEFWLESRARFHSGFVREFERANGI